MLTKVRYQERPERFEYRLTEKGLDLWPVLISLLQFGDRHYAPERPAGRPHAPRLRRRGRRRTACASAAAPGCTRATSARRAGPAR